MKSFLSSTKAKCLVAILAIIVGFMVADIYNQGSASIISSAIGVVISPLQKGSAFISKTFENWFQKNTDSVALYEENQNLKIEIAKLRRQMVDYDILKHENEQFSKIIDVIDDENDWVVKPAAVIARDAQNRFYSFTIDKGSFDGIEYLDPVMSSDGLVGYVSEVGATYSKVITILDVKSNVGVYVSSTRDIGVLTGTVELAEEGLCKIEYLPRKSIITKGDIIVTSGSLIGGSSMYPRDVIIGTVISAEPDDYGTNTRAIIKPFTNINNIKDVFVITEFNGQKNHQEQQYDE